jgi:hypothetical protein
MSATPKSTPKAPASLQIAGNVTGASVFAQASPADRARLIAAARLVVRFLLESEHEGEKQASASGREGGGAWPPYPD